MKRYFIILLLVLGVTLTIASSVCADPIPIPTINIGIDNLDTSSKLSTSLQILFFMTILSLAPAILIMTTSFSRIVIVLSFLRQAMGTQQMPPNQIIIGLALFLTFFVMSPVWSTINKNALQPLLTEQITQQEALKEAEKPIRRFMFSQTRESDLAVFTNLSSPQRPATREEISTHVLVAAFIISELKTAFQIGFLIYIPFLVLDMVVASVLMSMGMMMLPPIVISLPFKLMLFVMIDGWALIVGAMVKSFT